MTSIAATHAVAAAAPAKVSLGARAASSALWRTGSSTKRVVSQAIRIVSASTATFAGSVTVAMTKGAKISSGQCHR